jgi:beta-lactamase regulating signal transducer with metallopeptidase domain
MLVFLRLCLPALPSSALSLQNLMRARDLTPPAARPDSQETITFGIIPDQSHSRMQWRPALAAATPSPGRFPWTLDCAFAWLVIAAALMAWILARCLVLEWRISRLDSTSNPRLIGALLRAKQEARFTRAPRIIETSIVNGPARAGIGRSRLLIPPGLVDRLDDEQLHFVLLHELTHHRRQDVPVAICASLIACVHWFNPLVWLAAARFRTEREMACDAEILANTQPQHRAAYGETILRLLEMIGSDRTTRPVATMLSRRRSIGRRIQAVAGFQPPRMRWSVVSALLMLALAGATLTAATSAPSAAPTTASSQASHDSDLVTRVYDVRDLLIMVPNFDDAPDLTVFELADGHAKRPPAASVPAVKSTAAPMHQRALTNLERIVMDEIDSASWRDRGGPTGSIREMPDASGYLVITQTPANQDAIQRFFQNMRGTRAVQVTVEARFITGNASFARLAQIAGDKRWESNGQYQLWPGYLSQSQMKRLLAWQQLDRTSTMITAPRITLFNGQRAYVSVSRATAFVSWFTPNRKWMKPAGFEPQVSILNSGLVFDCAATASPDRNAVALVLRPQWSNFDGFTSEPWAAAPTGRNDLIVQVPHLRILKMKATTSIPDGQTAVFRIRPRRQPASTTQPAPEPMMLLVKPTIIHAQKSSAR